MKTRHEPARHQNEERIDNQKKKTECENRDGDGEDRENGFDYRIEKSQNYCYKKS